jgi:hypothetical protein
MVSIRSQRDPIAGSPVDRDNKTGRTNGHADDDGTEDDDGADG